MKSGLVPSSLRPFLIDQAVRDFRSVRRHRESARRLVGADVDVGLRRQTGVGDLSRRIDRPHGGRRQPTREVQQHALVLGVGEDAADRAVEGKRDLDRLVVLPEPAQTIDAAVHDAQIESILRTRDILAARHGPAAPLRSLSRDRARRPRFSPSVHAACLCWRGGRGRPRAGRCRSPRLRTS